MNFLRSSDRNRTIGRRLRTMRGIEPLESRTLFAGVTTGEDAPISLFANTSSSDPCELRVLEIQRTQPQSVSVAASIDLGVGEPSTQQILSETSGTTEVAGASDSKVDETAHSDTKFDEEDCQCSRELHDDDCLLEPGKQELASGEAADVSAAEVPCHDVDPVVKVSQDKQPFVTIVAMESERFPLSVPAVSELGSANVPSARQTFRYFVDPTNSVHSAGPNLSALPLSGDVSRESFISFSLLSPDPTGGLHNMGTDQGVTGYRSKPSADAHVVGSQERQAAALDTVEPPIMEAIRQAELALALAAKVAQEADQTRCIVGPKDASVDSPPCSSPAPAELAAATASIPNVRLSVPSSSLSGNLKLGLASIVSILFSIRTATEEGGGRRDLQSSPRKRFFRNRIISQQTSEDPLF